MRGVGGTSQSWPRPSGSTLGEAEQTEQAVAVAGHEGVEVDEVADPVGDVGEAAGHHHPAVGEAEQHDAVEVLVEDVVDDVAHVGAEVDLRTAEVGPLAEAGEAGREDVVAGALEPAADVTEAVGAAPRSMHQHVGRHGGATVTLDAYVTRNRPGAPSGLGWDG